MIQFNVEEFRADFAKALATRPEVEKIVETVEKRVTPESPMYIAPENRVNIW